MKYARWDVHHEKIVEERSITSLDQLADILSGANWEDWIEGLGQPMCHNDITNWQAIGAFLKNAKRELEPDHA